MADTASNNQPGATTVGQLHLRLQNLIGKGAYGECYEALLPNGDKCCVKRAVMKKGYEKTWNQFEKLCPTIQQIAGQTKTIMKVFHLSKQPEAGFMVTELCTGPSVLSFIKKHRGTGVPVPITKRIVFDTLRALSALHGQRIIHRDVKMDNLMFRSDAPDSRCVLLDLDACMKLPASCEMRLPSAVDGATSHVEGTTEYLAPESLHGIETPARDLWSVGVLLYCLLDTHFPYDPLRCSDFRHYHSMLMRPPHINSRVWNPHPEALDLLKGLLHVDRHSRISAADALNHPWFSEYYTSQRTPQIGSVEARKVKLSHGVSSLNDDESPSDTNSTLDRETIKTKTNRGRPAPILLQQAAAPGKELLSPDSTTPGMITAPKKEGKDPQTLKKVEKTASPDKAAALDRTGRCNTRASVASKLKKKITSMNLATSSLTVPKGEVSVSPVKTEASTASANSKKQSNGWFSTANRNAQSHPGGASTKETVQVRQPVKHSSWFSSTKGPTRATVNFE